MTVAFYVSGTSTPKVHPQFPPRAGTLTTGDRVIFVGAALREMALDARADSPGRNSTMERLRAAVAATRRLIRLLEATTAVLGGSTAIPRGGSTADADHRSVMANTANGRMPCQS